MKTIKRSLMMLLALIVTTGAWAQFFAANGNKSLAPGRTGQAVAKAPTVDGNWMYYDDGVQATSIGVGGGTIYWGIMLPASTLTGNTLEKVAVYENDYNTDPITLLIYSGGDTAPAGDAIYSMMYTPVGGDAFHEITLEAPVTFDASQNLWIVLSENGTYPANASVDGGDANGRWISLDGTEWMDVAAAGVPGYCWMIRAYLSGTADSGAGFALEGISKYGTVTFTVDGKEVKKAEAGKTVTAIVTPDKNFAVDDVVAHAFVDWEEAQAPQNIGLYKDVELTAAGENAWTFTMPAAAVEFLVSYMKDVQVTVASGDITAAVEEAAEG